MRRSAVLRRYPPLGEEGERAGKLRCTERRTMAEPALYMILIRYTGVLNERIGKSSTEAGPAE